MNFRKMEGKVSIKKIRNVFLKLLHLLHAFSTKCGCLHVYVDMKGQRGFRHGLLQNAIMVNPNLHGHGDHPPFKQVATAMVYVENLPTLVYEFMGDG